MAVMSDGPGAGRGPYRSAPDRPAAPALAQRLGAATHYAGAAVSLALVAGVAVWGYQLVMRDVNGIPVVRAMEGPMRVAPDNPGGELANHTGLAVNAIAAVGSAAPPEDVLTLAPAGAGLTDEDLEVALAPADGDVTPMAEVEDGLIGTVAAVETTALSDLPAAPPAGEQAAAAAAPAEAAPATLAPAPAAAEPAELTAEQVLALADQIAAGVDPLSDLAPGTDAPVGLSVEGEAITDDARFTVIPADVPGVAVSLRPAPRPGNRAVPVPAAATAPAAATPAAVSAALPAGTALVQFGAFESPEIAAQEWDRLSAGLGGLLTGKTRVIQEATSGGRVFFRLRASGFADMAEARSFCSAVIAEGPDCIPAVED